MSRTVRTIAIAIVAVAAGLGSTGASAAPGAPAGSSAVNTAAVEATSNGGIQRWCERAFDRAQRIDMESFRDYDAATFRAVHDRNAVSVFASGDRFAGIDAIMTALTGHFTNREAVWSWTELNRRVDGCRTAFIEYETTYAVPRVGFSQRALTVVTYTFTHGRWLTIMDQATLLASPADS